jgi:sugar phosphate permease
MGKNRISSTLNLTRIIFFVNAAVWLAFGIASLLTRALVDGSLARWVITVMMLINAVVMFWFGMKIVGGRNWIFLLAILYVALNVVLSITDQFGWIDALILLLNLCLLGLLFVARQRINQNANAASGES